MADDVTKNINYNYKTNVQTLTAKHKSLNVALGQVTTRTEKWQNTIGKSDKKLIGYSESTKSATKNTKRMSSGMQGLATKAKGLTSGMSGLALRFVGYNMILNQVMGAQQKLIDFIKESVAAYREFELRLAEISTILGSDQIPLMGRLQSGIENLSIAYGQATSDMSKGMYDILSAAFDAEDAINLLTTATQASIAGISDIRTSVDIFTTVLNTYGMQVEQATQVSNTLFQSVVRGKFQFQDLEQALGYVVPIAAQAGIAFDELMAALSTATRHGLHLDMTARGLALAIQGIVNPSTKATNAAEKYGIEMNGLALRVMGLHGWFEKLNEATKEFGSSILGELIPNMRSLRVAMVLAGDIGLEGFRNDLVELANMGNATSDALEEIMNTSQFVSNQLTQQWEQVKRDVGEDWDEFAINIQKGVLAIASIFNRGEYKSSAGEDYKFIKDDDIHNATSYLKILDEIKSKETERDTLEPDFIPNLARQWSPIHRIRASFDAIVDKITGAKKVSSTPVSDLNEDIADLLLSQEDFQDPFNDVVGGISTEINTLGDLELTLNNVELAIVSLEDDLLKTFVYGFQDASGSMKEASVSVSDLTTLTQEQREELSKLGTTIQGNLAYQYMSLHAQREYADATHDVSMGLEVAGYAYKEIPANIQAAVNAVRTYKKAQDENRKATQRMTAAMRVYQIQLLELQLKGMMRRRGLTRMEEKQIKKIQILQAKARLENMRSQKQTLEADVTTNQDSQELIDDYLAKIKEKQYELNYTYNQQIIDLETMISREGEKLQTRYDWWETTNAKIITNSDELIETLNKIMDEPLFLSMLKDYGLDVDELSTKIQGLRDTAAGKVGTYLKDEDTAKKPLTLPVGNFMSQFQNLPSSLSLPFIGQKAVSPMVGMNRQRDVSNSRSDGGVKIDNVTIEVKEIAEMNSVEKLAALLSIAEGNGLLNNGRTQYKFRTG